MFYVIKADIWIKPHVRFRRGKLARVIGHKRRIEAGVSDTSWKEIIGIGKLPTYETMPKSFKFDKNIIKGINELVEASKKSGFEVAQTIVNKKGKVGFHKYKLMGADGSVRIPKGYEGIGLVHTHPGKIESELHSSVLNGLSFHDIDAMIRMNWSFIIAKNVNHEGMWMAMASADHFLEKEKMEIEGRRLEEKFSQETAQVINDVEYKIEHLLSVGSGDVSEINKIKQETLKMIGKEFRNRVWNYCKEKKIKLYYGTVERMVEYDGTW